MTSPRLFVECGQITVRWCHGCGTASAIQAEVYVLDGDTGEISPVGPFLACARCEPEHFPPGMFEEGGDG